MRKWLGTVFLLGVASCHAPEGSGGAESAPVQLALEPSLPAQCSSVEIFRLTRPIDRDNPAVGTFSYGYRFRAPTANGAPVLVFLPGGPGMTSTDAPPAMIPDGWGYLLTDPRGTGCNTLSQVPAPAISSVFFSTEQFAGDVEAAIADRSLDDYVLFGLSYGTVLATVTTLELEQLGLSAPRAVVLEGVVGRALRSDEYAGAEGIRQWGILRNGFPPDLRQELDTKDEPYGISQHGWSQALSEIMLGGHNIDSLLFQALSSQSSSVDQTYALQQVQHYATTPILDDPLSVELYRQVACREIDDSAPAGDIDPLFFHGELVRNTTQEGTKCGDIHVTAPFDSAGYQFATKAYYFIGDSDVAAPEWQGAYHFDNHRGHAVRVVGQGAGHLSLELDQQACAPKVLVSIAAGGDDLQSILAACPTPVTVDGK